MVFKLHSLLNWIGQQFQLKPGKPDIGSSVRSLLSVLGPLGVGVLLGNPVASAIAILGAWFVGLVNVEGVYRQQATAKIAAMISITAMLLLANLVHDTLWLAAFVMFLVIFLASFVGVLGQAAATIGLTTSIMFVVALARFATFPNWSTILEQCTLCLAGGLWSIVLSLGIWQLRPYKPVTQSVANCYVTLSRLADAARGRVTYLDDRRNQFTLFLQAQDDFTQALTTARARWAAAWTAQRSANPSGSRLLILIENTPQIANAIVTLMEQVVIASDHPFLSLVQSELAQGMEQLAAVLQQMGIAVENGQSSTQLQAIDRAIAALQPPSQTLQAQLRQQMSVVQPDDYVAITSLSTIATTLVRLTEQISANADLIRALVQGGEANPTTPALPPTAQNTNAPALAAALDLLRDNLTVHSVLFRHALRIAIVATVAELVASLLPIPRGYWITLTAVVALKPNYGGTAQTTLQRVLGTVLGGIAGIAIVTLIHNPWIIGGCLLVLITVAMAVRPLSFSLFITLLTPAIVLLLNVTSNGGWQIGITRIADSLVGGILALLGSYLLFPRWERQQLPTQLDTTLRANLAYFQQVIAAYLHPDADADRAIAPLRRQAALENTNMAAAAQRLFSEPRHVQGDVEPITTLIFYIRRFFNSVIALAEHRQALSKDVQCAEFRQFTDAIVQALEQNSNALQQSQPPPPLPDFDRPLSAIHAHIDQSVHRAVSNADTKTRSNTPQLVQERTAISASLDQIAHEVTNIHSAINLLTVESFPPTAIAPNRSSVSA